MQRRVREYFYASRHLESAKSHTMLLEMMSPKLRGEVSMLCNRKWIEQVWFLAGLEENFHIQVALHMKPAVFIPDEMIPFGSLYVLHTGLVLYGGRVISSGQAWGGDMLISRPDLQSRFSALALGYANVYVIACEKLLQLAAPFPKVIKRLRYCAVRLALRREFIQIARAKAQLRLTQIDNNSGFRRWSNHAKAAVNHVSPVALISKPVEQFPMQIPTSAPRPSRASDGDVCARVKAVEQQLAGMNAKIDAVHNQLELLIKALSPSTPHPRHGVDNDNNSPTTYHVSPQEEPPSPSLSPSPSPTTRALTPQQKPPVPSASRRARVLPSSHLR